MGSRAKDKKRKRAALFVGKERAVVSQLDRVEKNRARFMALSQQLVAQLLRDVPLPADAKVIEIGAGTGQLRAWVPEPLRPVFVHTDPLELAVQRLQQRWPEADVRRASAESLPFGDGELGGAMALCVMDVVDDGARVAEELARALRPGASFIHLLDMTTELHSAFTLLSASTLIALPNVFTDPCTARWPEDLFLIPHAELSLLRDLLLRERNPFGPPLTRYLSVFETRPFPLATALAEFRQLSESAPLRKQLRRMFQVAYSLATPDERAQLEGFRGQPAASSRLFQKQLHEWFSPERGFEITLSDIVTISGSAPVSTRAPVRYSSLCVGEMRDLPRLPPTLLDPNAPASPDSLLLELGVFCFVARRT